MLERLFGKPEISGLESDGYWMVLFLGLFTAVGVATVLVFFVLPPAAASELVPFVVVGALVLAYPLAREWIRALSDLVSRYQRLRRGPRPPDE